MSSSHPLTALLIHGKTLAGLLRRAKSKERSLRGRKRIHEEVKQVIRKVLEEFDSAQDSSCFPEESICKFLNKIDESIEKFILLDPDNKSAYKELAHHVNDFKKRMQSSLSVELQEGSDDVSCNEMACTVENNMSLEEFDSIYQGLTDEERLCLFCFTMFPTGQKIKKRELIHLWVGMDLIDPSNNAADQMLANLVAEGLVDRVIQNKRLSSCYMMRPVFVSCLLVATNKFGYHNEEGSWRTVLMMHTQNGGFPARPLNTTPLGDASQRGDMMGALLNISEKTLNAKRFESLFKMKNVKVLHLGSWHHDPKNYIVVDDIEVFRYLTHLDHVQVLSLQGVSGIVTLPDSIYKLKNLKVLDLKACHSLEVVPEGIESLNQLMHLDMSECYLLDYVPKGIAALPRLQVLKGFVINCHANLDGHVENGSNKKRNKQKNLNLFASSCPFHELSKLELLRKLTVRTRNMNFPTHYNLQTLCQMKQLTSLRIAWVGSSTVAPEDDGKLGNFPQTLKKMELQAAPEHTSRQILRQLSEEKDYGLQKLCIRGGGLRELKDVHLLHVKVVRLRYLPNLQLDWDEFKELFPNMTRLEVFECPNLFFFPCDENGVWELPANTIHNLPPVPVILLGYTPIERLI